jgi:peptide chain release factor
MQQPVLSPLPVSFEGRSFRKQAEAQFLQISAGQGPDECCWVVGQVAEALQKEGKKAGVNVQVVDQTPAGTSPSLYQSLLLKLEGQDLSSFAKKWTGTIQWIGESLFRPGHKRKNWFVGVQPHTPPADIEVSEKDLIIQRVKASGPGGQKVNKTSSAVRIIHKPSGISIKAQDQRSQSKNYGAARQRLSERIRQTNQQRKEAAESTLRENHTTLERGNPVRIFKGKRFQEVKP